jgi:hypothetical protein
MRKKGKFRAIVTGMCTNTMFFFILISRNIRPRHARTKHTYALFNGVILVIIDGFDQFDGCKYDDVCGRESSRWFGWDGQALSTAGTTAAAAKRAAA